ncbi:unnamed protein product [Rhizoctonia solani]|uniref:CHAT domain-containing protein n=1 Tax=Rhizoctonia solani TaxID=456999 RepID=A0A8H2XAN1_9AGAM|nr:unnamed protein product [Rhizoctonia solani]
MASQETTKSDPSHVVLAGHMDTVYSVAFSPDGESIVSGSRDKTIRTWNVSQSHLTNNPIEGHREWIWAVSYSPFGGVIASGSGDRTIRLWDVNTGQQLGEPMKSDYPSRSVAFSPDAKLLASAADSGSARFDPAAKLVQVWDVGRRTVGLKPFKGHTNWVTSIAFSPDGARLVSSSFDKTIHVWDVQRGETTAGPLEGHANYVYSATFSPDGSKIASCSKDCTLRLWDIRSKSTIDKPYEGHTDLVWSVAFSSDGIHLVSGGYDRTVRLWDIRVGRQIDQPFEEHTGGVHSVAFSPCGRFIASGSHDRKVILRSILNEASESYSNLSETPSFSTVDKMSSGQPPSIEHDLGGLQEQGLLTSANASQLLNSLNQEATDLETKMRDTDNLGPALISQFENLINKLREFLEQLHLPDMRNDSSYQSLLDLSLSVLTVIAGSLLTLPQNQDSREYFRLSKRSLMIATSYLPKHFPEGPTIASVWSVLYFKRFQLFGNKNYINQSIKFLLQCIGLMPGDHPPVHRAHLMIDLVRLYLARFQDSLLTGDLESAIEFGSKAWVNIHSKTGDPTVDEKDAVVEEVNEVLQCLVEHVGESNSISLTNTGIRELRGILYNLLKHDETEDDFKVRCMRTLGLLYITRFDQLGSQYPRDLENGLAFFAAATALLPKGHKDLLSTLCALADLLVKRGAKLNSGLASAFLGLANRLSPNNIHTLIIFGDFHMALSRQEANSPDLGEAIKYYNKALTHPSCYRGSKLWAKARQKLAFCRIYEYKNSIAEESPLAIKQLESALLELMHITLSPRGDLYEKFTAACSWATNAASHPAFQTHALYGYETALELISLIACFGAAPDRRRKAIQKAGRLATEAAAIAIKENDYALAVTLLEQGRSVKWNHTLQLKSPLDTLTLHPKGERLARNLEEVMKKLQSEEIASSTESTEQLRDLQSSYRDVLTEIREIPGSADSMRSVKWNHTLQLKSSINTLTLHPKGERLARNLEEIMKLQSEEIASSTESTEQLRGLQSRYRDVLTEIRKIPGFADFMRSRSIEALEQAARNGPVVVINVHESRCGALIVHPSMPVQHIPLPQLSESSLIQMRDSIVSSVYEISQTRETYREQKSPSTIRLEADLKNLWYWVVEPILKGLQYKPRPGNHSDSNELPRVTWCATGPLSYLPLHAAGDYDDPQMKAFTFEYVISSYTPTLSALIPDPLYDTSPESSCDILMVNPGTDLWGVPFSGAKSELDRITYYFDAITGILGQRFAQKLYLNQLSASASNNTNDSQARTMSQFSLDMDGVSDDESDQESKLELPQKPSDVSISMKLEGPEASLEKVYEAMQKYDWAHFACHVVQNNPIECGFYLGDKLLSLQRITQMPYKKRGLAFLCGCRPAQGLGDQGLPYEAIHLGSGMLAVGYSNVITTLWPARDNDAAFVADVVYKRLLMGDKMKCHNSAVALHEALDKLRQEPGVQLSDWIPFAHFGA